MHARLCPSFVDSLLVYPEQLLVIGEHTARPLLDFVRIFALKREELLGFGQRSSPNFTDSHDWPDRPYAEEHMLWPAR